MRPTAIQKGHLGAVACMKGVLAGSEPADADKAASLPFGLGSHFATRMILGSVLMSWRTWPSLFFISA